MIDDLFSVTSQELRKLESIVKSEEETALSEAQKGMKKAQRKADPEFVLLAKHAIQETAKNLLQFTTDDVRKTFETLNPNFEVVNWSVIGPLMKEAKVANDIRSGGFERSKLPQSHGHFIQIWHSNIYQKHLQCEEIETRQIFQDGGVL